MTNNKLSKLESFRYEDSKSKITKPKIINKRKNITKDLPDLRQSINSKLKVLFIGFNPGVESSIQQHHYAHHSNLFWKLFNQSKILEKIIKIDDLNIENDEFLKQLIKNGCSAKNDFELIDYNIGFTDLVLRCTAKAEQLSNEEKLENVPRLLQEFKDSNVENIVIIGKGIWEVIVKYLSNELDIKVKLNKDNFKWGLQKSKKEDDNHTGYDKNYNLIVESIYKELSKTTKLYVFPNTSGLVASLTFAEKLELWQEMVHNI
ncbi:MAG: mismatch-specific DNA-glycosylase [Asgard group archaeon]|nr:mismatch-specific DNA-glycosylase [Asgard group archaeon]